jgi:hypothetical protein
MIAPVVISLISRVMPNVIAHNIVGVSPMTGPVGRIFDMKHNYMDLIMEKKHYQHFLRLPNRRKQQKITELSKVYDYTCIQSDIAKVRAAQAWCKKNLKDGSWVNLHSRFVFAYDKDATWFAMAAI